MSKVIRSEATSRGVGSDLIILDGMSCVGGNTISFSKYFGKVIANELDQSRFNMLQHNVNVVMSCSNVDFHNASILELVSEVAFDILFLDPEWGGPSYKESTALRLTIGEMPLESFILQVFGDYPRLSIVALKLPVNYDNAYLKDFATQNGFAYKFFFKQFRKMTLTLLTRKIR